MNGPVIVSQRMMLGAINRPEFFNVLPEFGVLKVMMQNNTQSNANCRTCVKRRTDQQLFSNFASVVGTLPPDRLRIFKQFVGVEAIQLQGFNRRTSKYEVSIK